MKRDVQKYLRDVLSCIQILDAHLATVPNFAAYRANLTVIDAVERRLSIIGEAIWKAGQLNPDLPIQHKERIRSLRHKLIHDYDLIDDPIIWAICKKDLPQLKADIEAILQS